MMLWHREHPQEEMTTLDYIPSLHLSPPLHPQLVSFIPVTEKTRGREIAEETIHGKDQLIDAGCNGHGVTLILNQRQDAALVRNNLCDVVASAIDAAIAAERERCANIADRFANASGDISLLHISGLRTAGKWIADAIRNAK